MINWLTSTLDAVKSVGFRNFTSTASLSLQCLAIISPTDEVFMPSSPPLLALVIGVVFLLWRASRRNVEAELLKRG